MKKGVILVVDDDPALCKMVKNFLAREGYRIDTAHSASAARDRLGTKRYDLVIVDLVLPDEDGLSLTRHLRANFSAGVIILSGKGDPVDRVVGIETGADDYLAKPFLLQELGARVHSVLRQQSRATGAADAVGPRRFGFADWIVDRDARNLVRVDGEIVPTTTAEFDLLMVFLRHPNRVLSRNQLLDLLHGRDWNPTDRSIDVIVGRLRKKIEAAPDKPGLIKTVHGVGYVFTAQVTSGD